MGEHLLFVYDFLLNSNVFRHLCEQQNAGAFMPHKVCNAHLPGYALCWNSKAGWAETGAANIIKKRSVRQHDVWGTLFSVTDEQLSIFAKKQSVHPPCRLIEAEALTETGNPVQVLTCVAEPCPDSLWSFPSSSYFNLFIEGCCEQELPGDYLEYIHKVTPLADFVPFAGKSKRKSVIYSGSGVVGRTLKYWQNIYASHDLGTLDILNSNLYCNYDLSVYDLAILPGGDSREMCAGLGEGGVSTLRDYVNSGGKLLGVCAGAYAVSHQLPQFLSVSPVTVVDYDHAHRGTKNLKVIFNEAGQEWFGVRAGEEISFFYHNGPVPIENPIDGCYDYQVLATFGEELRQPEGEPDTMLGWPAAWRNRCGLGEVFAVSPHIEQTDGKEFILANFIRNILK